MRYKKPPILEAVLEFRWAEPKALSALDDTLQLPCFESFGTRKTRFLIDASINMNSQHVSHSQRELGLEVTLRDGSEKVFLEEQKFVFIRLAPYDRWELFLERTMSILRPTAEALNIAEFTRIGLRYVNRIDVPNPNGAGIDTDQFVTVKFDGPRPDRGVVEEFQMRVVKSTEKEDIFYALVLATTPSPLPGYLGILLDIDVFTQRPLVAGSESLMRTLGEMRVEKNDIFEECLTDASRELFGGILE